MSMEDFTTCMRSEYNADDEAVRFIGHILDLGSEDAIHFLKENWAKLAGAAGLIGALAKVGGESVVVKFVQGIFPAVAAAVIDLLVAFILGLGLAACLLAITAAEGCMPRLAQ